LSPASRRKLYHLARYSQIIAHYLIPFAMSITEMKMQDKIWLWKFPAKGIAIEEHGSPIIAHIRAHVSGISPRFHCLHTLQRKIRVCSDTGSVSFSTKMCIIPKSRNQ